jgi:hypothetical protein
VRVKALLRELVSRLGEEEVARRTGYSVRTIRSGKISSGLRDELRAAQERSERASRAAETRKAHATRIDASVDTKKLARAERVSEKTVERWKEYGNAPAGARDAAKQILEGREPYRRPEAGASKSVERSEREKLRRTMGKFVEAVRERAGRDAIGAAYRSWRRVKLSVRRSVTAATWDDILGDLSSEFDLPDTGVFSKERFKRS